MSTLTEWPNLTLLQEASIIAVPTTAFIISVAVMGYLWPPYTLPEEEDSDDYQRKLVKEAKKQANYGAMEEGGAGPKKAKVMMAGEVRGDYNDVVWTESFDLVFLLGMIGGLAALVAATEMFQPELWSDSKFWMAQIPKITIMMAVSCFGGAICRWILPTDDKGYVLSSKSSVFKVNYTRKIQHFAAYAIPLVVKSDETGTLALFWSDWVTLIGFLVLIKPIREAPIVGKFFMLQFNSLDRPEDRPDTLKWIIAGNILPGLGLIVFFRWALSFTGQEGLAFIFVLVTGVGDGLAEPVGITWGKHKYRTRSCTESLKYTRSYEGSACVFISTMVFTALQWYDFHNPTQFWLTMAILPPLMTLAEATSPHTMDTPLLMTLGGGFLWAVTQTFK